MARSKRKQVTCDCFAYEFPHRFGGGRCNGMSIVETKFGGEYCSSCPAFLGSEYGCDVLRGSESTNQCEYVIEFCEYHEIKIP